jgi:hypothetical protein
VWLCALSSRLVHITYHLEGADAQHSAVAVADLCKYAPGGNIERLMGYIGAHNTDMVMATLAIDIQCL